MRAIPTARILKAVRDRKWTVHHALFELLDNALGELRGRAADIWIRWHPRSRVLTVLDNGQGMRDVIDLFSLGKGAASGAGDNGAFGVGGSEALLWLSDYADVVTLRDGQVSRGRADWQDCLERLVFPAMNNRWRRASVNNCPLDLLACGHGTRIQLTMRTGISIHPDSIQERLSKSFAVALRSGRRMTWVTEGKDGDVETQLHAWDPGTLEDTIDTVVTVDEVMDLSAHVRAGWTNGLSIANSKLSVNYVYRQVKETTEGFGRPVQGAVGFVDLSAGWLRCLTTTKDDIRTDCRHLEEALMSKIALVLRPLIEKLQEAKREMVFNNISISLQQQMDQRFRVRAERIARETPGDDEGSCDGLDGGEVPPRQQRARRLPFEPGAATIQIQKSTDEQMDGHLCNVELQKETNTAVAFINKDHRSIQLALDQEPVNRALLENYIVVALVLKLVALDALATVGLFSKRELDILQERYSDDVWGLIQHLIRVLTDGVVKETA